MTRSKSGLRFSLTDFIVGSIELLLLPFKILIYPGALLVRGIMALPSLLFGESEKGLDTRLRRDKSLHSGSCALSNLTDTQIEQFQSIVREKYGVVRRLTDKDFYQKVIGVKPSTKGKTFFTEIEINKIRAILSEDQGSTRELRQRLVLSVVPKFTEASKEILKYARKGQFGKVKTYLNRIPSDIDSQTRRELLYRVLTHKKSFADCEEIVRSILKSPLPSGDSLDLNQPIVISSTGAKKYLPIAYVVKSHPELLPMFVEAGAKLDVDLGHARGLSLYALAAMNNCVEIMKYIDDRVDRTSDQVNSHTIYGNYSEELFVKSKQLERMEDLLRSIDAREDSNPDLKLLDGRGGRTPLMWAIRLGNEDAIEYILQKLSPEQIIKTYDYRGRNAIYWATIMRDRKTFTQILKKLEGYEEDWRILSAGFSGNSPLEAVQHDDDISNAFYDLLVENGFNAHAPLVAYPYWTPKKIRSQTHPSAPSHIVPIVIDDGIARREATPQGGECEENLSRMLKDLPPVGVRTPLAQIPTLSPQIRRKFCQSQSTTVTYTPEGKGRGVRARSVERRTETEFYHQDTSDEDIQAADSGGFVLRDRPHSTGESYLGLTSKKRDGRKTTGSLTFSKHVDDIENNNRTIGDCHYGDRGSMGSPGLMAQSFVGRAGMALNTAWRARGV